jgi:hypothetical protein
MDSIESRRTPWRMLTLGSYVWAPFGDHGWRPGTIIGLGKESRRPYHRASQLRNRGQGPSLRGRVLLAQAGVEGQEQAESDNS